MSDLSMNNGKLSNEALFLEEEAYLDEVLAFLLERQKSLSENQARLEEENIELNEEAWEEHMEYGEFNTNSQFDSANIQNALTENFNRLQVQKRDLELIPNIMKKPYFAHIRFAFYSDDWEGEPEDLDVEDIYIGYHDVNDLDNFKQYVVDWRAPIANVYYDSNNLGPASYENKGTIISGELLAKYQIEILQGKLLRVIDTDEQIFDEILQMILSSVSSAKMQEIVQTLQKEQNIIVRSEPNRNLIVQGVAGSGKSSIALHRAAYLLYVHKDIRADNILLITPSDSFASYISNVLPNLGEENVRYMTKERIISEELAEVEGRYANYPFVEASQEKKNRLSTFEWVEWVYEFSSFLRENMFQAEDIHSQFFNLPSNILQQLYNINYRHIPPFLRKEFILNHLQDFVRNEADFQEAKAEVAEKLDQMFLIKNLREAFAIFTKWVIEEKNLEAIVFDHDRYDYCDAALLCLLKVHLYGASDNKWVRHLIVDEMQDMSALEHESFRRIFVCPRTLLGDVNQAVQFPLESNYLKKLLDLYQDDPIRTQMFELKTSYRSTKQITEFSREILEDDSIQALQRQGDDVVIDTYAEGQEELMYENIWQDLLAWKNKGYRTALIVSKDRVELEACEKALAKKLAASDERMVFNHYLQVEEDFAVSFSTVSESKGVEFDGVIVLNVTAENYADNLDKTILYVAATRALHSLKLTALGKPSRFLPKV